MKKLIAMSLIIIIFSFNYYPQNEFVYEITSTVAQALYFCIDINKQDVSINQFNYYMSNAMNVYKQNYPYITQLKWKITNSEKNIYQINVNYVISFIERKEINLKYYLKENLWNQSL